MEQASTCAQNETQMTQLSRPIYFTSPSGKHANSLIIALVFHQRNYQHLSFASNGVVTIICNFSNVMSGFVVTPKHLLIYIANNVSMNINNNYYKRYRVDNVGRDDGHNECLHKEFLHVGGIFHCNERHGFKTT